MRDKEAPKASHVVFSHPFVVYTSIHYSENFPNFFTRRFQGLVEWHSWSVFAQLKTSLNFERFHWSWSFQILPCLGIYLNSILKSSRWDGDKCPYSAQSTGKQRVRVSCRSRVYIKNLTEIIWVREARRGDFSSKAVLINLIHHDKFTIQYERWGCLKMPFSVIQGWKKVCLKERWKHHKPKSVIRIWTVAGWDNARDRARRRRHLAPPHTYPHRWKLAFNTHQDPPRKSQQGGRSPDCSHHLPKLHLWKLAYKREFKAIFK